MMGFRREMTAGLETIKVDQILYRENLDRLEAKTEATFQRIDRNHKFLEKLLFWDVSQLFTVGGGVFWKAAQVVNRLDDHGRRIEVVEKDAKESQARFRESFDKLNESQTKLGSSFDKLNESQTKLGSSFDKLNDNQTKLRDSLDRSDENQVKLRDSIDQLRRTLDERLPIPPR